ncbi:hypothetical protein STCU_11896 [Strigomonas culicis]|uniref:Flagellar attachment zone protein 1 conserved domain-containing protein n=1 Tax=Strigomonas culicis TaxID=28005 RepID=S9TFC9_9TRYP|nr:hypothetical protein STCU_11896 [Strigomonas culicis]|eukprot:EPY15604.1 hypothetical protein STCU_11896 [Strigomonas culicis]
MELEVEKEKNERGAQTCEALRTTLDAAEAQHQKEKEDAESELVEAKNEVKKVKDENEALNVLLDQKEREIDQLKLHDDRWKDSVGDKKQVVTRHTKIFDGNWSKLLQERPEALFAAFVVDASNACHVPGNQVSEVGFDHD